jgi:site-specific recombinase XerD
VYEYAIDQFIAWYCSEPRLAFNRIVVVRYRMHLESRGLAANTINQQLAAVRRLAHEASDSGLLSPELAAGISRVKGVKQLGFRSGNWLSAEESSEVLNHANGASLRAKRDYAMLAMLFGCGFRRSELVGLEMQEIQIPPRALGGGRSDWQGRSHSHCSHSRMGQSRARPMDGGRPGNPGKNFSGGRQN